MHGTAPALIRSKGGRIVHRREPMQHQRELFDFAYPREATGVFMDPGTGKTKASQDLIAQWWLDGDIECAIVLAPNGVHHQWINEEIPKDMAVNVPWRGFAWRRAPSRPVYDRMNAIVAPNPDSLLIVTFNYESAITEKGRATVEWLLRKYRCALVVDESSRIRNPTAQRTKMCLNFRDLAVRRLLLTGTPSPKGWENLWAPMKLIGDHVLECPSFTAFKHAYCQLGPVPGVRYATRIVGYRNTEDLMERVRSNVFTKRKADCLDLPPVLPITRALPMTPEQRTAYKSMFDQHFAELSSSPPADGESVMVMVNRVIAARTKLRQIAVGFVLDERKQAHWITQHRLTRIVESLEDSEDKVIIWSPFIAPKAELGRLLTRAGIPFMHDEEPGAQREFNDSPVRVLLANPQRSGIGFNMANCGRHIWVAPVDDEELRIQARDRTHRMGQTTSLVEENYVAPGTVEGAIRARGAVKAAMADLVMARDWRALLGGDGSSEVDEETDWTAMNEAAE